MSVFQFKQFSIDQTNAPFKVGTDGVLLGALSRIESAASCLEIGTGTGLIPLMLAQRGAKTITALEIDQTAFLIASQNFANSSWNKSIIPVNCSLQEFESKVKFDLIVSNPPYFESGNTKQNKSSAKARHTHTLSPEELIEYTSQLLTENGSIQLIYPADIAEKTILIAEQKGLHCTTATSIYPTPNKPIKRIFFILEKQPKSKVENELIIETGGRHQYSEDYIHLTKAFYLNM